MEYLGKLMMLPEHMRGGMQRYIERGIPPGSFLFAVLSNNLKRAVSQGDQENLAALADYVRYLYNYTPSSCWGSPDRVDDWIAKGGMFGGGE